ncbi:hypothetical protein QQP08_008377 [Theobroma cacao]|nr:hypothetical protein QQP08_008377 [Theobroma cacao]
MKCLLILYNPDFGSAFDEIFLSLPQFFGNDSSTLSAWSCMVTEKLIWQLAPMLSETSPLELKICCAEALSMLNVGSVLNSSRMIDETEALMFCLAKLVEAEDGEFQYNCLMTIMEITAVAESDLDLRCKTFKTNSPRAEAIVEQLLRVIKELEDHPKLQVPAIKSIAEAMEEARVRTAIQQLLTRKGMPHRHGVSQHPELKELFIQFCPLSCLVLDIPATFDDITMSIFQAEAEWIDGNGSLTFADFLLVALAFRLSLCCLSWECP